MTRAAPSLLALAARLYRASVRARRLHRPVRITLTTTPGAAALMARLLAHGAYEMDKHSADAGVR